MKDFLLLDVKPEKETKVDRLNRKRAAKDDNTTKDREKAIKLAGIQPCFAAHFAAAWEPMYIRVSWLRVKKETKFGTSTTSTFVGPNLVRMAEYIKKHGMVSEGCDLNFIDEMLQWEIKTLPEGLKDGRDKINMVLLRAKDTLQKILTQDEADNLRRCILWSGGKAHCPMQGTHEYHDGYWGLSMVGWRYLQKCLVARLKTMLVYGVAQASGHHIEIKQLWLGSKPQGEWEGRLIAKNLQGQPIVTKDMHIAEFDGSYSYKLGVELGVIDEVKPSTAPVIPTKQLTDAEFLAKFKVWSGNQNELIDYEA